MAVIEHCKFGPKKKRIVKIIIIKSYLHTKVKKEKLFVRIQAWNKNKNKGNKSNGDSSEETTTNIEIEEKNRTGTRFQVLE